MLYNSSWEVMIPRRRECIRHSLQPTVSGQPKGQRLEDALEWARQLVSYYDSNLDQQGKVNPATNRKR